MTIYTLLNCHQPMQDHQQKPFRIVIEPLLLNGHQNHADLSLNHLRIVNKTLQNFLKHLAIILSNSASTEVLFYNYGR